MAKETKAQTEAKEAAADAKEVVARNADDLAEFQQMAKDDAVEQAKPQSLFARLLATAAAMVFAGGAAPTHAHLTPAMLKALLAAPVVDDGNYIQAHYTIHVSGRDEGTFTLAVVVDPSVQANVVHLTKE